MAKVLIGGGSGFVGRRLVHRLTKEGFSPVIVSRNAGKNRMTWDELYHKGLPDNCTAVVNLAGENLAQPFTKFDEDYKSRLYDSRIETTKQFVDAILKAEKPPEVYVGSSAIGYYPPSESARYDETSQGPDLGNYDFMSRLVRDWELAASPLESSSVRHVTVRIGIVLGREGGLIQNLYLPFFFGLGGRVGSGRQWTPWIHADDMAGILHHSIRSPSVTGVLNGVAPNCVRNEELVREFARAMRRPAVVPTTEAILNVVFGKDRARMMTTGQHVSPKRTLESGYAFKYTDVREALKECSRLTPQADLFHED